MDIESDQASLDLTTNFQGWDRINKIPTEKLEDK